MALLTQSLTSFAITVALHCSVEVNKGMANTVWMVHVVMQRERLKITYLCMFCGALKPDQFSKKQDQPDLLQTVVPK